jgi:hypothetical protein
MDFASIVDWFSQESMNAAEQTNEPKRRESRGLGRPHIAAAIDSAFIELGGITRSRIVDELGAIAFANIGQVLTWGDEIQEISEGDIYFINGEEHLAKEGITRLIRQRVRVLPSATMDPPAGHAPTGLGKRRQGNHAHQGADETRRLAEGLEMAWTGVR